MRSRNIDDQPKLRNKPQWSSDIAWNYLGPKIGILADNAIRFSNESHYQIVTVFSRLTRCGRLGGGAIFPGQNTHFPVLSQQKPRTNSLNCQLLHKQISDTLRRRSTSTLSSQDPAFTGWFGRVLPVTKRGWRGKIVSIVQQFQIQCLPDIRSKLDLISEILPNDLINGQFC